jgi:hypothetical protein
MTASLMGVGAALRARRQSCLDSLLDLQINYLRDKKSRRLEELQTKKGGAELPQGLTQTTIGR